MDSIAADWIGRTLPLVFPPPIATSWRRPASPIGELPPEEAVAIVRAVEKRRAEFAAGRNCARQALAGIGVPGAVIPAGADRAPVWPAGTIGSIAHADGVALAVAARVRDVPAIGVDVELTGRVKEELWSHILTTVERAEVEIRPAAERANRATAVFAIKEAFYKFQYPLTRSWRNFEDVEVTVLDTDGTFVVRVAEPVAAGAASRTEFTGCCFIGPTFTLAGLYLRLS